MSIRGFSICETFTKYNEAHFLTSTYVLDLSSDSVNVMSSISDMVKKTMKSEMLLERPRVLKIRNLHKFMSLSEDV